MNYGYTLIDGVIAELQETFKEMNLQGKMDPDLMEMHAIECIREIGIDHYVPTAELLDVKRYTAALPKGLIWINYIWEIEPDIECPRDTLDAIRIRNSSYRRRRPVYPANETTLVHVSPEYRKLARPHPDTITFFIKRPPPVIQLSIPSAKLAITYYGLKKDEQGRCYMHDEVNSIKCVKAFIMRQLLISGFTAGTVPKYVYDTFNNEYDTYLPLAQAAMHMESPMELDKRVEDSKNRYSY